MMEKSRWEDIYDKLKEKGFDVYSPTQKTGECIKPYVVIKTSTLIGLTDISSKQQLYDIMCYVPKDRYSYLEHYVSEIENTLDELFPLIRPTHNKTPSYYDDEVKGHMISIEYVNYQKKRRA